MVVELRSVVVCLACNSVVEIVIPSNAPAHFAWLSDLAACPEMRGVRAGIPDIKNGSQIVATSMLSWIVLIEVLWQVL